MAVTADVKGTAILRNKVADYLNTEPGGESPAYHLMNVFETIDENPNAQVVEKHYTSDKAATKLTSGYAPQFPITGDQYLDNDVSEFIRDIAEEQQIGVETDFIRVRLYQPIASKENTFSAECLLKIFRAFLDTQTSGDLAHRSKQRKSALFWIK